MGEAIHDRHGNTLDAQGLKRLRERIRVLSGDTVGGASMEDLARGIARRFSDLPPLPRTTAPVDRLQLTFDELWTWLQSRHSAVLQRGVSDIQRARLDPAHRHFASATSRTRTHDATPEHSDTEDHHRRRPPNRLLTTEGSR